MKRSAHIKSIQSALTAWHEQHKRDLPWRRQRDAYAVWVSEIMLQQTQVVTVKRYFAKFLKKFPDVNALARASIDDVLKVWEGMGYYGRARSLHKAAQRVVDEFSGRLPRTAQELRKLPGIGRYTAGAIASIAFGEDEPVLDGNVTRVFCRVFRVRQLPAETRTQKKLWALAHELVPSGRAGFFNEALMDLGATICTPRGPRCDACPLKALCAAHEHQEQEKWPRRAESKPLPHYDIGVGVVWRGKRILIDQRPPEGLLGGLWEFPGGKRRKNESLENCVVREIREEMGIEVRILRPLMTVRHAYTHFRITLHVYECRHVSGRTQALGCTAFKWVHLDELDDYAFPSANKRIIAALRADE